MVPLVGPAVSLAARAAIGPGTRPAQIGKAIGEIVGGFIFGIGGTFLTLSGGGAPAGLAALSLSATWVLSGVSVIVGAYELESALASSGEGGP